MLSSSYRITRIVPALALAAALAACGRDPVTPEVARPAPAAAHFLLGPGEFNRTVSDTTDAAGNEVTVTEYAAGTYTQPDGLTASVASVTIKTVIPPTNGSGSCITSTVVGVETTAGWTADVKKSGGCDKDIVVELQNAATRQKATFKFLMKFGETRIDAGRVG